METSLKGTGYSFRDGRVSPHIRFPNMPSLKYFVFLLDLWSRGPYFVYIMICVPFITQGGERHEFDEDEGAIL